MSTGHAKARILHEVGGAVWLGGSLMGAVGLNGASQAVSLPTDRIPVANSGWARWSPVNAAAIGAHLLGGLVILVANRDRAAVEKDVKINTIAKFALTIAAVGTTAYSGVLGAKLGKDGHVPADGGVIPSTETPPDVAKTQQQLRALQWATPAMMAVVMGLNAQQGEQQQQAMASGSTRAAAALRKSLRKSS